MRGIITLSFIPHGTQVSRGTDRSSLRGRKRLKERKTDPPKGEKVNFPFIQDRQMNTLNLIRKQINKASALHDAQITHTAYRGIVTKVTNVKPTEVHGKFTYRGHTYTK